ncbi:ComEC/Rec2 family competence protein [Corynebacterium epidermidicanis]|uniref:ComEC/Rec2-related protein n=1 Tax=Corynebacterium epidermidicanis TaxID=1050174 RepID=A0A0G3GRD5_9CORY|nr:ComEC/Rec2 family competence protein [Corynebacterium epidermidicanis]AKK03766.1 ComEC/Rec2-related protein [Corynebacterium epidermidicanis]
MSELRLVPAALVCWGCCLLILYFREPWLSVIVVSVAMVLAIAWRAFGQAMVVGVLGAAVTAVSSMRVHTVDTHVASRVYFGQVAGEAIATTAGGWLVPMKIPGLPGEMPVIVSEKPPEIGTHVVAGLHKTEGERVGLYPHLLKGESLNVVSPAAGIAEWANEVKETFRESVVAAVGPKSEGLLPGMVLGDTGLQDASEKQLYIDAGLSHLSAVSGSNVTLITVTAVLLCRAITFGPRLQMGAAACALAGFVLLVGLEPSVLRASVTGVVGLIAVLGSAQTQPIHALCLAVIGLLLWDSSLAASYGFALSVAATAGIVTLFPLIYRGLANRWLPDVANRALAVAVAADVVTLPLIALMAGRVPTVSVLANVLVAPAVAPVTIFGLIAAGLSLLPGGLEWPLLKLAEPFTWWIHTVAARLTQLSFSSAETGVGGALLAGMWIVWFFHTRRVPHLAVGIAALAIASIW